MEDTDKPANGDEQNAFMLKEYDTLHTLRRENIALGDRRFNFYISIILGASVFLPWASAQQHIDNLLIGVIMSGILLLGLTTLARMVRRNASIIRYTRAINRIRRYFSDHHPDIRDYLFEPTNDDQPQFQGFTFSEQLPIMLAILNSLVGAVLSAVLASLLTYWSLIVTAGISISTFSVMFLIQMWYYSAQMKRLTAGFDVKFPTKEH